PSQTDAPCQREYCVVLHFLNLMYIVMPGVSTLFPSPSALQPCLPHQAQALGICWQCLSLLLELLPFFDAAQAGSKRTDDGRN
ncbi:hypothetical protein NDU88_011579, partial [Pleurodeles waltl]